MIGKRCKLLEALVWEAKQCVSDIAFHADKVLQRVKVKLFVTARVSSFKPKVLVELSLPRFRPQMVIAMKNNAFFTVIK